jgi:hypothetical protein
MADKPEGIHVVRHGLKKESLPAKVCKVCGDGIARTRRAARDWERLQYCSAVCRRMGVVHERIAQAS